MTDEIARTPTGPRVRRTTVPHPQRWRSPHEAGWNEAGWNEAGRAGVVRRARDRSPEIAAGPTDGALIDELATAAAPAPRFGRPVRRFRNIVVHSATPADGDAWAAAKRAELEIFAIRNGWATAESTAAGEVLDYAGFADRSEIFVATPAADPTRAVGVARMIWGTCDLSLEEQFLVTSVHRIDPEWAWLLGLVRYDRVAEWATLGAVGTNLSPMFALWTTLYRTARERGVDYWVQSIVESLFSGYRDGFGMPMMQIGDRELVVGAESIPTVILLEEVVAGHMVGWDLDLKRELFGPWFERPRPIADGGAIVPGPVAG